MLSFFCYLRVQIYNIFPIILRFLRKFQCGGEGELLFILFIEKVGVGTRVEHHEDKFPVILLPNNQNKTAEILRYPPAPKNRGGNLATSAPMNIMGNPRAAPAARTRPRAYSTDEALNSRLRYGEENVLQVISRGFENESRWYPGAGIYRDVWLWQGDLIHVHPEGVRLTTAELEDGYALVLADVAIENTGLEAKKLRLCVTLTAPNGRETSAENVVSVLQTETVQSHLRLVVEEPDLWSPDRPALYTWTAELFDGENCLDRAEGSFGVRKLCLDARHGLRINGAETKLRKWLQDFKFVDVATANEGIDWGKAPMVRL